LPRPWTLKTNIPVFSLALVLGDKGARRWLVYAHSPLEDRRDVTITVPDLGKVTVDVPRAGAFYLVDESDKSVTLVSEARGNKP
jgi:proline racemase